MKMIIAGGRDFIGSHKDLLEIAEVCDKYEVTEIISGGARGADQFGETFANLTALDLKIVPAEWDLYGKSAGYKRNVIMAELADIVFLFPGGKGTDHMKNIAIKKGLIVIERSNL